MAIVDSDCGEDGDNGCEYRYGGEDNGFVNGCWLISTIMVVRMLRNMLTMVRMVMMMTIMVMRDHMIKGVKDKLVDDGELCDDYG